MGCRLLAVSYRPFKVQKAEGGAATVATFATLRAGKVQAVATVAGGQFKNGPLPEVHRCDCGAVGVVADGWFLRSPERGRWFCSECYRVERA